MVLSLAKLLFSFLFYETRLFCVFVQKLVSIIALAVLLCV